MSSSDNIKSIDNFFTFDDDRALNAFMDKNTSVPYWLLIRNSVLRTLINKQLTANITGVRSRTIYKKIKMLFVYCLQFTLNIISLVSIIFSKRDVILVTRSESYSKPKRAIYTEYLIERLSIPLNRVVALESDESGAEIFRNEMIILKTSSFKHVLSIICLITSKFIRDKSVDEFMAVLYEKVTELEDKYQLSEEELSLLTKELRIRLLRNRAMNFFYRMFIYISNPKLIICEEGFYQHSVLLNKIASEKNIVTVEMQHGVVHQNHDAYNYSDSLVRKGNSHGYFPNLFLTWGPYWEENVRIPSKTVSVGFPYRSTQLNHLPSSNPHKLLVLGDGANTEKYLSLCERLALNSNLEYQVVFRPHPMERVLFESNSDERRRLNTSGTLVDLDRNLYHSLSSSSVIISEMSTCLFEAIGIVDRILVWRTDVSEFAFRKLPFEDFSNLNELAFLLTQSTNSRESYETAKYWTEECHVKGVGDLLNEGRTF